MSRPRTFDYEAAQALVASGLSYETVGIRLGVSKHSVRWACRMAGIHSTGPRAAAARAAFDDLCPAHQDPGPQFAVGISTAIRRMRARVRLVGPLCVDSPTVAAVHAAGLTLDDIDELFAVPPAEAVRAIAAHAGR